MEKVIDVKVNINQAKKNFDDINERIEAIHFRIESEIADLKDRFSKLYENQSQEKTKFFGNSDKKEEPKEEAAVEEKPKKKGWFGKA